MMIQKIFYFGLSLISTCVWAIEGSFSLSYLYMQATEDYLDYAISSNISNNTTPPSNGCLIVPKFDWQSAIQTSASVYDPENFLGAKAVWTHYISKNSISSGSPTNGTLYPTQLVTPNFTSGSETCTNAASSWSLTFDSISLFWLSSFFRSERIYSQIHSGIQTNWIRQKFDVQYNGLINQLGLKNSSQLNQSINSWGLGPAMGLYGELTVYEGFYLLARSNLALAFSKSDVQSKITNPDISSDLGRNNETVFSIKETGLLGLKPNTEIGLGFGWTSLVSSHEAQLSFSAEYDLFVWFNQNQFLNFIDDSQRGKFIQEGNLYLHGLNAKASVSF